MADQNDTRQQGVEFGEFGETMASLDYPIDHDELVDQHGNAELGLPDGHSSLSAVLEPLQDEGQTYRDADELETMILNMVGDDAVGREGYSDRGASSESNRNDEDSL